MGSTFNTIVPFLRTVPSSDLYFSPSTTFNLSGMQLQWLPPYTFARPLFWYYWQKIKTHKDGLASSETIFIVASFHATSPAHHSSDGADCGRMIVLNDD
jgi:hypothetical protein